MSMVSLNLTLRAIADTDMPFLRQLYALTREEELKQVVWQTPQQYENFITMQFNAQHTYYHQHYTRATFSVIELDGQPIGRIYINRFEDEYRLMEMTLLTEYRNRGIGTALLKDLLRTAEAESVKVGLHVEPFNPAYRLYERYGFQKIADVGVYVRMEWQPPHLNGDN